MNTQATQPQAEVAAVTVRGASLRVPDADSAAEAALDRALRYCGDRMGVASLDQLTESLRQGEAECRGYYHYALAREVADYLSALDADVQAVYLFDYDATPEDVCFCESDPDPLMHVIVQVRRRTAALESMLEALDGALARRYAEMMGIDEQAHLLDAQIVDEEDTVRRAGYGALLSSLHHRPLQVWGRGERPA